MKTSGWKGGGEGECRIYVFVYLDLCVYLCLYLYLRICDCVSELMTTSCFARRRMCERMRAGAATGNESPACCCVAANGRTTPGTATPPTKTRRTPGNKTHGDEARPARKLKGKKLDRDRRLKFGQQELTRGQDCPIPEIKTNQVPFFK